MKSFRAIIQVACMGALASSAPNNGLTVHTIQGDVLGTQVSPGVRRFLGIPFAVSNRWEAPQVPPSRNTTFLASTFGPSCPQAITPAIAALQNALDPGGAISTLVESEDCLSVNVWAPSVHKKQNTAVMIWIYGGGFQIGTSNSSIYDGQTLVQNHEDITVVSFNYRLNILGQPGAPQLYNKTHSQSFGLLDIDAAVQWVYDNIAVFGGNPERIILFGESAGSIAIDAFTFAHPQDKRVKGVIQQSGTLNVPGFVNGTFDPTPWNTVANAVGCGNDIGLAQLDCLKGVPFKVLVNATVTTNTSFNPVSDGMTVFADTKERSTAGQFLHVPLLGGTTAHESDLGVLGAEILSLGYPIPVLTELLSDVLTQIEIACPTATTFNDRIKANVSTWRYLFSGIFRSISPLPELRAYHSSEISLVFGTTPNGTEERGLALSKYMQDAWVAFARDPENGLTKYGWPQYAPDTTSLAELGGFYNGTGVHFLKGERVDFTCGNTDVLNVVLGLLLGAFPNAGLVS